MKEETVSALEKSLVTILDKTISGVEQGVAFLSSEIPDVIRQLLLWHGVKNAVLFSVLIIVSIASLVILVKFKNDGVKRWKETIGKSYSDRFDPMLHVLCGIVFLSSMVICFIFSIKHVLVSLQIWLAPKVWLIEYTASLVK